MSLTEAEEAELLELLQSQYDVEPFGDFIRRQFPHEPPPPHISPLIELIERSRHEEIRATISMPPRHAKSVTIARGLVWRMLHDPGCVNAFLSYGADLALRQSRQVRRWAVESGVTLAKDAKSVGQWATEQGGGLIAVGIGGAITGMGITGLAIVDDPFKNREEASSPVIREKVWEEFQSTVFTRLQRGASCIVVQTRWHEDDLIGRIHNPEYGLEGWEKIDMPAIRDEMGRASDEGIPLWPEQFDKAKLDDIRKVVGEYGWWSLYQGQPRPKGNTVFKFSPSRFALKDFKLDGHRLVIGVDPAASEKTHADYSVAVVMAAKGYGAQQESWILDIMRCQTTVPDLCRRLVELQRQWRVPLAVEAVGAFKAIPQILKEAEPNLSLLPVELRGDKFSRSQPLAAAWNDDRVYVPVDAHWADTFLHEITSFTGVKDKNDDQVDAAAHAFTALYRAPAPRKPRTTDFLPWG